MRGKTPQPALLDVSVLCFAVVTWPKSTSVSDALPRVSSIVMCMAFCPFHVHVEFAALKLIQHLGQTLFFRGIPFRACDPANVIILLVIWSFAVGIHQLAFG